MEPSAETRADLELPRAIALAWGVAAHPQRGPKRELSIERIVDTAIALADEGGLAAVSMANVANRLGYTPMSLYRYVTSKDDLLVLMQEQGIGLPPEEIRDAADWRDGIERWTRATIATYREHPWLLDIRIAGMPTTPNNLSWLEALLEVLAGTPLSDGEKVAAGLAATAYARWQALVERGYSDEAEQRSLTAGDLDRGATWILEQLVSVDEFPRLHAALAADVFGPESGDPFTFGLDRLLDGLASHIAAGGGELRPFPPEDPPELAADKKVREAVKVRRQAEKALHDARKQEREVIRTARERLDRGSR